MLHPNGFLPASFLPLKYEPDGKLLLSWSERGLDDPPWELRLELGADSNERWGYVSLIPVYDEKAIALDMNVLTREFRVALSKAVERACSRMEAELKSESDNRKPQFHKIAAGL